MNYDLKIEGMAAMPNIGEIFDLWPYLMRYVETVQMREKELMKFEYSFPLDSSKASHTGGANNTNSTTPANSSADSIFQVYFETGNQALNRMVFKANSLDVSVPVVLYAVQPITAKSFSDADMSFEETCRVASIEEQLKFDTYVDRIKKILLPDTDKEVQK